MEARYVPLVGQRSIEALIQTGDLKKVAPTLALALKEVSASDKHARLAELAVANDLHTAGVSPLWSAYRHAFNGWLRMQGLEVVGSEGQHLVTLQAIETQYKNLLPTIIANAKEARRMRNEFEYETLADSTPAVADEDIVHAVAQLPKLATVTGNLLDRIPIYGR